MKRFTRALAAIFSLVVLGSLVLLIAQKKVSAQGGGPTITIGSPLPLYLQHIRRAGHTGFLQQISPTSIKPEGGITGFYFRGNLISHGFRRDRDGTIATFDPPRSISTFGQSINPAGAITGSYTDASDVEHGYLRTPDGVIIPLYANFVQHGFVRSP